MNCPRCIAQGTPENFASEPQCAFPNGVFQTDNWMCGTMRGLRRLAYDHEFTLTMYDESIAVVPIIDDNDCTGFIVMTYYKDRGRTSGAVVVWDDYPPKTLTLEVAEACLLAYEMRAHKRMRDA